MESEEIKIQAGELFANRYEIVRLLGEGGMARVFEARRGHGRVRAITIDECLPPGPAATAFESFFHARNLASIEERGLYPEAA